MDSEISRRYACAARYWPLAGVLASLVLFVMAAAHYPGGLPGSSQLVGYDWTRHYVCTLFPATALNGAPNRARYFAIPAMLLSCVSLAYVLTVIAKAGVSRRQNKAISIGGVGAMVYAFAAVVTPMHDLLVAIAVLFFLVAAVGVLQLLWLRRYSRLAISGVFCLAALIGCVVMYYATLFIVGLPVVQKISFVACIAWILAVYLKLYDFVRRGTLQASIETTAAGDDGPLR